MKVILISITDISYSFTMGIYFSMDKLSNNLTVSNNQQQTWRIVIAKEDDENENLAGWSDVWSLWELMKLRIGTSLEML